MADDSQAFNTAFEASYVGVSGLKDVASLNKKLETMRRNRQFLENQWKINLAFYKGRQYSYFNRASRRLESLPVEDGEKPRYRVRLVSNQIITGAHSLLAKFTKTKPQMRATSGASGDNDIKAAQMSESLLEYWWDDLALDEKLDDALLWSIIAGQGYWKITWDPHAGKSMKFTLDPQGKPITDDSLKDLFTARLNQAGVQPQEKVVYLGDLKVEAFSPFDIFIDPSARTFDDAKYAICVHHLDPDEVQARWKYDAQPDSVTATPDTTLPIGHTNDGNIPNVVRVNIGYFRPQAVQPKGRYVVWTKNKILEDGPWPYPFTELPLIKFPGLRIPGSIYDSSVVEHAIPLQKELNRTLSQIIEYKNLTIKPRVWAPVGAITTRLTSEPGALYEYNPVGDHKPEIEKLPTMPPYVFEHLTNIRNSLKEVFGITDITEGTPPPNVEAGIAIDLLQEMATDKLAPTIKLMELALGRAGQLMLTLAQKYYIEPRLVKIQGSGGTAQVKRFTQADIAGDITVRVEAGSGLPRTHAGRQARILAFIDKGIIRADQAYKYLDLADLRTVAGYMRADEDQALREHDLLIEGGILNDVSHESALSQLESGQAVDDQGQPINTPQAAQEFLRKAGLQPFRFENFEQHLDTHANYMKSPDWKALPLEIKQQLIDHYNETLQVFFNLPKPVQYEAVRPTMQIKTTVGPTAASEILNKAGVYDITPQVMTEPPLDTWVNDDLSKSNVDESGNSKQDADALASLQQAGLDKQAHAQDLAQKAELHQAQAREANAKADAAAHGANAAMHSANEQQHKANLAQRTAKEKRINPPAKPKQPAKKSK